MTGCSQIQLSHLYFGIPDQLACCKGHGGYHRHQMGISPTQQSNPNGTVLLLLIPIQNISRRFWKAHLGSCPKSPTCLNFLSRPRSNVCFPERVRNPVVSTWVEERGHCGCMQNKWYGLRHCGQCSGALPFAFQFSVSKHKSMSVYIAF